MIELTKNQKEIILDDSKVKRVISCAGSGKTTVIISNIAYLIDNDICKPFEILAITFTKNAAENMRLRIRNLTTKRENYEKINIYTFNSFGNLIISENSFLLGYGKDYKLINIPKSWQILYEIVKDFNFLNIKIGKDPAKFINDLLKYIWDLKSNLITINQLKNYCNNYSQLSYFKNYKSKALLKDELEILNYQNELILIYENYEDIKKANNLIDYHDHVFLPYQLLSQNNKIRQAYSKRYKYIFIDEYQDTDVAQGYLISLLFNPNFNYITIVGDDDQSIYSFRGACVENILNFHNWEVFSNVNVKDFYITENFRSGKKIISSINKIISNNLKRFQKKLECSDNDKFSSVFLGIYNTPQEEAKEIANKINYLIQSGVRLKDIAIFLRRKKFNYILKELENRNIKYEVISSKGFFYEEEVLFLISWLIIIDDIRNEQHLLNLLQSKKYNLSDRDIFFLKNYNIIKDCFFSPDQSYNNNLIDSLIVHNQNKFLSKESHKRISEFLEELEYYLKQASFLKLSELINLIFHHSGLYDELKSDFSRSVKNKIRNIEMLIKISQDFELNQNKPNLNSFILYLKEVAKTSDEDPETIYYSNLNTVKIMSIHAAKGLEFDVVFMPMLRKNEFLSKSSSKKFNIPSYLRKDKKIYSEKPFYTNKNDFDKDLKKINIEEERRIFYVGCSRAKNILFLSFCKYDSLDSTNFKENVKVLNIKKSNITSVHTKRENIIKFDNSMTDKNNEGMDYKNNKEDEKYNKEFVDINNKEFEILPFIDELLTSSEKNEIIPINKQAFNYINNLNFKKDKNYIFDIKIFENKLKDFINYKISLNKIPQPNKIVNHNNEPYYYNCQYKFNDQYKFNNKKNIPEFNILKFKKSLDFLDQIKKINKEFSSFIKENFNGMENKTFLKNLSKIFNSRDFLKINILQERHNFSLSELLTFINCPLKYLWQYYYNFPEPESKKIHLGKIVHDYINKSTLIQFSKFRNLNLLEDKSLANDKNNNNNNNNNDNNDNDSNVNINIQESNDILSYDNRCGFVNIKNQYNDLQYLEYFLEQIPKSTEKEKVLRYLNVYFNSIFFDFKEVLNIYTEQLAYWKLKNFIINCQFDRIDFLSNKTLRIIDFKVARISNDINYKYQLIAYTGACVDIFSINLKKIKSYLFFLEDEKYIKENFTIDDINLLKHNLINAAKKINILDFNIENTIPLKCKKSCSYKLLCNAFF